MIKETEIKIKIASKNLNYFLNLKYNCKYGDDAIIKVLDLSENSHVNITAICDICGKESIISIQKYNKNFKKYDLYTCRKCSHIKNKKTNLDRYNDENYHNIDKSKQTNLIKYGCENVFQNEEIKEKIKSTNIVNHGVEYPQQNKDILEKSNNTNLLKYGFKRSAQNEIISNKSKITKKERYNDENYNNILKIEETNLKKYNVNNVSKLPDHKLKIQRYFNNKILLKYPNIKSINYEEGKYYGCCDKGHDFEINIGLYHNRLSHNITTCTICYPEYSLTSDGERKLSEFIKDNYDGLIIKNDRKILDGKELDIYLPDLNIAFEYNGTYWHSNIFKDENYHNNKIQGCENKNVKLYHIWESEWLYNNETVKYNILKLIK